MKDTEGSHCRMRALIATDIRLKNTSGGAHQGMGRSSATGGVRHVVASTTGESERNLNQQFSKRTLRHTECGNQVDALKLLGNRQQGGDSSVKVLVEGLQERSRSEGS